MVQIEFLILKQIKIKQAIGGLTSLKVTLPNSKTPITLTKKADGWYNGATKVEVRDGKLVVPVPAGTDLTEAMILQIQINVLK